MSGLETTPTFLAYFDILGYSDYLESTEDEARLYGSVRRAVDLAKEVERQPEGYVTRTFSDNVLMAPSADNAEGDVERALHLVTFIAFSHIVMLVDEDAFIRGSIVYDSLLIDKDVVFGRGIVSANAAEHRAVYPCTILDESALRRLGDVAEALPLVRCDADGEWYVDYFAAIGGLASGGFGHDEKELLMAARSNLCARVRKYCSYPHNVTKRETIAAREKIIAKHAWVLTKFNDYCYMRDLPECAVPYSLAMNGRLCKYELKLDARR